MKSIRTTVLETLLGDNPFNGGYPTEVSVFFERDGAGRVRLVYFTIYDGSDDCQAYRGVLANWRFGERMSRINPRGRISLAVRRPREFGFIGIVDDRIIEAFAEMAKFELASQLSKPENMEGKR